MAAVAPRRDDELRLDGVDLAYEELGAGIGFYGLWRAVGGWAALDDVSDVDLLAREAHGEDHVGEELAGFADEGQALRVFIGSGAFADEHEARGGVAGAEDDGVTAGIGERAAGAVADVGANGFKRGGALCCGDADERQRGRDR